MVPCKVGVWQGSSILFLVNIDWIMEKTTADKPNGFTQLEDHDFADDLAVVSTKFKHLQEKCNRLNSFAMQMGLNINPSKTKVMCINSIPNAPITVKNEPLECQQFYSFISKDNAAQKDIQLRLRKARA